MTHKDADFTIATDRLLHALRTLQRVARMGRRGACEVVLEFGQNELHVVHAGTRVTLPAAGCGEGLAAFGGESIRPLVTVVQLLGQDTIRLWTQGEELHIGTSTLACRWADVSPLAIPLPLNASLRDILQLRYTYAHDELVGAGLEACVFEAELQKDGLIAQAADILKPLGISLPALDRLIRSYIRDGTG